MSSSNESTASTTTDVSAESTESGPGSPVRIRLTRIEVTPADITIFSAITGRPPNDEERERALTWAENDPANVVGNDGSVITSASASSTSVSPMSSMKFWTPSS